MVTVPIVPFFHSGLLTFRSRNEPTVKAIEDGDGVLDLDARASPPSSPGDTRFGLSIGGARFRHDWSFQT
jgi:hypothetical protein